MSRCTAALLVLALAACGKKERAPAPPPPGSHAPADAASADPDAPYAWYRVEATVEAGVVPFVIGVHRTQPEGVIFGGEERLPMVVVSREPLRLRVPVRGAELVLHPDGPGGRLTGQWLVAYYFKRDFDLVATPIKAPRIDALFPGGDAPAVDLTGTWTFDIEEFGVGRGHLRQAADGTLAGTLIPPEVGDLRHLTGRVTGTHGRLSVFDGIHGYALELDATDGGAKLSGRWSLAGFGDFAFTATRAAPPPTHVEVSTHMATGATRLSLPELDKPPYAGNPVIVDYFGTWCPVCIDLMPELVRLQRQHAAAGLQVYSVALEPTGDEAATKRRLDEFRAAYAVSWPFHVTFTEDYAAAIPTELVDAIGFPVTVFLRRDHTVAAIHTGFVSTAAAAEHAAAVQRLDGYAAEIVASPASK